MHSADFLELTEQIGAEVEAVRKEIIDLQEKIQAATQKRQDAIADIKKLEKDMNEFKNNKEGKIDELKVGDDIVLDDST